MMQPLKDRHNQPTIQQKRNYPNRQARSINQPPSRLADLVWGDWIVEAMIRYGVGVSPLPVKLFLGQRGPLALRLHLPVGGPHVQLEEANIDRLRLRHF